MKEAHVLFAKLNNAEEMAAVALEVTSVPHTSIISDDSTEQIVAQYKDAMASTLSEVYQIYQSISVDKGTLQDVALELLWTTSEVQNQPYNADIRLFVIARSISDSQQSAADNVNALIAAVDRELKLQKYETAYLDAEGMAYISNFADGKEIRAVVRQERTEDLQNPLLPYCYNYDKLPADTGDLSKLVDILIQYPDNAVSFQIMPTVFSPAESSIIGTSLQALEQLSKGVSDGTNIVKNSLADIPAITYKYYQDHKSSPLFLFNALVYAGKGTAPSVSARLHSLLANGAEESADLSVVDLSAYTSGIYGNFLALPWFVNETLIYNLRNPEFWDEFNFSPEAYYRLPYIVTNQEAVEFFRMPVGSNRISAGLKINESEKGSKAYADKVINVSDIPVGKLRASTKNDTIGFSLKDLTRHMLITGSPGSGKTTFSVGLLDRLWKEYNIPFLVIEPAKNEYRALVQSIPDLQVFTPGKSFISPFVYNPFVPPENVRLEAYKSTLKTAFAAAIPLQTPLDKIFDETVNNCYSDFRWIDTYTSKDGGKTFNIHDFISCFERTFEAIGYTGDAKNIGRAGSVRLNSLARLFESYSTIPIKDLITKPTVIELAAIENREEKALIIALILLAVLSYVNANYLGDGKLKNVILLEEAHVLLEGAGNNTEGTNAGAVAQELIKRMLAEIRAYGVGLVIADQSPKKVTTDVVGLTDIKLTFRLVEGADKQIIADSTSMSETQMQRLSRLKTGEAVLFYNRLNEPEEVITADYRLENKISTTLSDEDIASLSTYWKSREEMLRPYPQCKCVKYCNKTCDYGRRVLAREVARRIFNNNFRRDERNIEVVKKVFSQISNLVKAELNYEEFTPELLSCVKVHLWRKIKYETHIPVKDSQIEKSLNK